MPAMRLSGAEGAARPITMGNSAVSKEASNMYIQLKGAGLRDNESNDAQHQAGSYSLQSAHEAAFCGIQNKK
jgi:hypothetical protein